MTEKVKVQEAFQYGRYTRRKYLILLAGIAIALTVFFVDLFFSIPYIQPSVLIDAFLHPESKDVMHTILWDLQMPTVCAGILCGASFGFAGAIMQTLLNNPLASPYTLGISAGAGFGASLTMVVGLGGLTLLGTYMVPAGAFLFAMLATGGIFMIAKAKGFSADIMVLAGIGLVFLFQALQSMMQYLASPDALSGIVFWTFGSLNGVEWMEVGIILVLFLAAFILIYRKCWALTAMRLGDRRAEALGINTQRMRKWMFVLIALLTSTCVAFVGCIGFIGIVGPHVARMILGEDQRYLIPMSCVCGAIILETADILCGTITSGMEYPIGIFTSIVGVPFFFYLLMKKKSVKS
ncbi:MAG: iron ABC transporter permease [Candidatus Methanomethylophilaceae archaeon]|jgi:iron complex transport system permease protein|nr:iron ABC transporter permease [Candidatus Methanomethylophilaceae archaeon]